MFVRVRISQLVDLFGNILFNKINMIITSEKFWKIMEEMADKTLSFGCKIEIWNYIVTIWNDEWYCIENWLLRSLRWDCDFCRDSANYSIIWHPLHIWDVLNWMEVNKLSVVSHPTGCGCCHDETDNQWWVLELWKDKCLPLSPTDEELVDYIYNILQ